MSHGQRPETSVGQRRWIHFVEIKLDVWIPRSCRGNGCAENATAQLAQDWNGAGRRVGQSRRVGRIRAIRVRNRREAAINQFVATRNDRNRAARYYETAPRHVDDQIAFDVVADAVAVGTDSHLA